MKRKVNSNIFISFVIFAITNQCYATFTYNRCDESQLKGTMNWINVSNCNPNSDNRCSLKKGTNVTITTSFTSTEPTNGLKVKVYGKVAGLSVPWRVSPDDACLRGVVCPINANDVNVFTLSVPVSSLYPNIPVEIKLRLQDSMKKPHYCVEFPAQIVD